MANSITFLAVASRKSEYSESTSLKTIEAAARAAAVSAATSEPGLEEETE